MTVSRRVSESKRRQLRKRNSRLTEHEQALNTLQQVKEMAGKVIHVVVSNRTTIELPADTPQEEIDRRVERYKATRTTRV